MGHHRRGASDRDRGHPARQHPRHQTRLARRLRLSTIVTALGTEQLVQDLLSDDLLHERGWHTNPYDERGVGETAYAQIEYADLLVLDQDPGYQGTDLLGALARPDAKIVTGFDHLDGAELVAHRHQHARTNRWCSPTLEVELPPLAPSRAWRLDLSSPRPFHPERLLDDIELLGTGEHRSRGCFRVPTRPGAALEWSGAGGNLSIGSHKGWSRSTPFTRLMFTGVGTTPTGVITAFEDLLLTPEEAVLEQRIWDSLEDGLEPWLGDIQEVA